MLLGSFHGEVAATAPQQLQLGAVMTWWKKAESKSPRNPEFPVASIGAQAAASSLWAYGTLHLGFLGELLLVCTAERLAGGSALGQGEVLDLSHGWQEGEARHSRPKSLPHVLLVSVSHVHGEPLLLISS